MSHPLPILRRACQAVRLPHPGLPAWAAAMLLACVHGRVAAQAPASPDEGGPIVIEQSRRPQESLYLAPGDLTLTLVGVYQHDTAKSGDASAEATQWAFRQQLGYETRGYVIDPNFVELNIGVWGGVEEVFADINGQSANSTNPLTAWDLSATFLRSGEWPLTIYSKREDNWIFRTFGGAIQSQTTETGARLDHTEGSLTTHLDVAHLTANQSGSEDFDDISYTQDRISWFSTYRPSSNQTLDWSYNYANTHETGAANTDYATHDASLVHEGRFGDRNRSSLRSSLNWSQLSGYSDVQRLRWGETLMLRHTDSLRTRYDFTADRTEIAGMQRDNYRGKAGFIHELYRSLTTSGNVGAQYSDSSDGGSSTEQFADITWDYRKQVPYGLLLADLGFNWAAQQADATGAITVVNSPQTFPTAQPIVIIAPNIDPASIIIRDPSGILYRPGIDYTTRAFADRIEIERIIGGGITDGQTVLVDYTQGSQGQNDNQTQGYFVGLRYTFDKGPLTGLSLYGRYAEQTQTYHSDTPNAFIPNSYTDTLYGVEYRFSDFTLGAERQQHDSTIYPYDADRYFARYIRSGQTTNWSINAAFTTIDYPDENNRDDLFTLSARVDHRFSTYLTGDAAILWRDERNRNSGDTTGFEEQVGLRWKFRQIDAFLQVRASQLSTQSQDTSFEFVRVGVERKF